MKPRSYARLLLALVATIEVAPAPTRNLELVPRTVWQDVGLRGFYGPWSILVKRNGDYVDYADYGARVEQYQPNLPEMQYDDVSITGGYRDAAPSAYDNVLSKLNTMLSSAGLADFRTGIRSGDWIDRSTDDPELQEEGYREYTDSQKVDGDTTDEADDAAILSAEVHREIL
ncbi:uncharacterized protein LOC105189267 [Harpegnathos saltator]|uniref:Uncharacterized protein n=1 Tax=Harpegnathos saltator TaxID=610380 RepID=E2C2M5_HARSA|nr:uncharacterized protein LOC105189267 [Harpegnathos saltator]EFN77803.1 hypothetical protein EAI_13303 [Harpegnathos saltator]